MMGPLDILDILESTIWRTMNFKRHHQKTVRGTGIGKPDHVSIARGRFLVRLKHALCDKFLKYVHAKNRSTRNTVGCHERCLLYIAVRETYVWVKDRLMRYTVSMFAVAASKGVVDLATRFC